MFNDTTHQFLESSQGTATVGAQPKAQPPRPDWASGHVTLKPYEPTPEIAETVDAIVSVHRLRQRLIKAQTKLILQAKASLRFVTQTDADFSSEQAKEAARKRNDDLYERVKKDETHPLHANLVPYMAACDVLDVSRSAYEREMVHLAKRLPVYSWVKGVKGFGDISFATIVGECGDIGTYKSVSAVWKRLGLAVYRGRSGRSWRVPHERGGDPAPTAQEWSEMGYVAKRRSVSWNARNQIIGGMGMWRPEFGSDLADATYYQRVFAERARVESVKLDMPVTESAKGKESYKKHVTNRAMRYTEKRLLRNLYIEWRRA